ncbi:hypothetical protein N7517_010660 [Penicillium concentricum]|uniref:Uncharacterized protein n=1 Tax=Penicillium concentricum TaxID=293559 RepID=A0A9W9UVA4_9EURO|nr:uncharacterized protein N7517_010660 [Penicillium concentricum]KAJ5356051.1 hypothetical protein N7517_010660 [Penicillium concentricum]
MAPIEIPRTSGIGTKLEGTHNYHSWFQQLKAELCATDPLYWPIIMGVNESPAEPKYQHYTHEEAISFVAKAGELLERLLEETIEQNKLLSHKHDAEPEEWEQLNYRLRLKFCSTLDKVPASHIEQVFDARSAFLVIKSLYDGLNMQPVSLELQNWTSIRYKKDVQMETFLACFKQAGGISKDRSCRRCLH